MNFFGWDSTDPAGIARSYLEPGTNGLDAKRARITLKYKRTQRLYFTNMGLKSEKLLSTSVNFNFKKIRVTWEGDGVFDVDNH